MLRLRRKRLTRWVPTLAGLTAAATLTLPAFAQDNTSVIIDRKNVPAAVVKAVECGTEPESITRRPFAGGFVFAWPCPGNHANWITALVYAPREDGDSARLIRFPTPRKKEWLDEGSNVEYHAKSRELTQIMVDPETRICRSEGRWRLVGAPPQAKLMFWRETRDCHGRRGWRILVKNSRRVG
jgi:hypothetical protein